MRLRRVLATIALLGAVISGVVLAPSPSDSVLAGDDEKRTTTSLNRGW